MQKHIMNTESSSSIPSITHIVKEGSESNWPPEVVIYTDGASRNNPGDASIGLVVYNKEHECLYQEGSRLGVATNNVAEYSGILRALELAKKNKIQKLLLKTDSELITKQMMGHYRIKSPLLKPIYKKCNELKNFIPTFKITHVPREENKKADELANQALDLAY